MNPETIFSIANLAVLPGWLALFFLPGWRFTRPAVVLIVVLLQAALYTAVIGYSLANPTGAGGNFSSLAGVAALFQNPWALLGGWVHYLCFDLFVGNHLVGDARRSEMPHWIVAICLIPTFLFGPAGFLLYTLIKLGLKRAPYDASI